MAGLGEGPGGSGFSKFSKFENFEKGPPRAYLGLLGLTYGAFGFKSFLFEETWDSYSFDVRH